MTRARWIVFAYHTIGARALEALVARGEHVAAVVTHADDPGEGSWFESVADVARIHRIPCLAPPSPNLPETVETLRKRACRGAVPRMAASNGPGRPPGSTT